MNSTQILTLGLGLEAPWTLKDQHLDTAVSPHRLDLHVEAERGNLYPCPECGKACPAHDFTTRTWRHLNFFQHHCYLNARVPRAKCPEHGIKRVEVPWARPGSDFTLLWIIKEKLRWIQQAPTPRGARWRITHFLNFAREAIADKALLAPVRKALNTLERHADRVIRRWLSALTNARLEGMNSLFQAARSRARGYRNEGYFITMIYLIGSPVGSLLDQAKST